MVIWAPTTTAVMCTVATATRNTSESNEDHADTSQHANKYDEHTSTNLNTDAIKNGPIPPAQTPMPSSTTTNTSRNTNESDNKHDNASTIPTSTMNMPTPTSMTTNGPRLAWTPMLTPHQVQRRKTRTNANDNAASSTTANGPRPAPTPWSTTTNGLTSRTHFEWATWPFLCIIIIIIIIIDLFCQ